MRRNTFYITLCLMAGLLSLAPSASAGIAAFKQSLKQPVATLNITHWFGIGIDPQIGEYLFYEGHVMNSAKGVTIAARNPASGERAILGSNFDINPGDLIGVNPSHGWLWMPGEQLSIEAEGCTPTLIQLPAYGTPEWNLFVISARNYTNARKGGGNLNLKGEAYDRIVTNLRGTALQLQQLQNQLLLLQQLNSMLQMQQQPYAAPSFPSQGYGSYGGGSSMPQSTCLNCGGKGTVEKRWRSTDYGGGADWKTDTFTCPVCLGRGTR